MVEFLRRQNLPIHFIRHHSTCHCPAAVGGDYGGLDNYTLAGRETKALRVRRLTSCSAGSSRTHDGLLPLLHLTSPHLTLLHLHLISFHICPSPCCFTAHLVCIQTDIHTHRPLQRIWANRWLTGFTSSSDEIHSFSCSAHISHFVSRLKPTALQMPSWTRTRP